MTLFAMGIFIFTIVFFEIGADVGCTVVGDKCVDGSALLQTRRWVRANSSHIDFGKLDRAKSHVTVDFEEWKQAFHASLGDMCGHYTWDYGMVCRNADGTANNDGYCQSPKYWDDGLDTSREVHTGLTACEANRCLGKPAGGKGSEPNMFQMEGWVGCSPPSDPVQYEQAFFAGTWKPPGETRACVPICTNRARRQTYRKVMCNFMQFGVYTAGLRNGNAHCFAPARNCNYNDHTRASFYQSIGMGRNCDASFNTAVFDRCATDPTESSNCEVVVNDKTWNVLNTCWDGAWERVCENHPCFILKSLVDQTCVATCKSYYRGADGYDECVDEWKAAGCPDDGQSFRDPDLCENSTEPPSPEEVAIAELVGEVETTAVSEDIEGEAEVDESETEDIAVDESETEDIASVNTTTTTTVVGQQLTWECHDWCSQRRVNRHDWQAKCWVFACHTCDAWQRNCVDIWRGPNTAQCAPFCRRALNTRPEKRCRWVNCMGCEEWEEWCTGPA